MSTAKLPPGWPAGVPLPTREEAEEAVYRIGQRMDEMEEEQRNRNRMCRCMRLGLRHGPWCPDWKDEETTNA